MSPDYNGTVAIERVTVQRGGRYKPSRCSICRSFTWFYPLVLKELEGVPEPRHGGRLKRIRVDLQANTRNSSGNSPGSHGRSSFLPSCTWSSYSLYGRFQSKMA